MISDRYKCIFVEVPKTGSTSIRKIIGKSSKPHLNICQIAAEIDSDRFNSYFKFGFVRNPWDRVVSLYERKQGLQMRNKMSFSEFVQWIRFSSATCIHPMPHRYQLDWFVDPHGNVLADFIGKFENLCNDWSFISGKLGINQKLPHLNKNANRRHYSEYYTTKTKLIIMKRFSVDIEYFEYEFL